MQMNYIFKIIIELSNSKKEMSNQKEMSEKECQNYEVLLQKLEGEIRNHIQVKKKLN